MTLINTNPSPALNAALGTRASAQNGIRGLWAGIKNAFETIQRREKLRTMSPHLLRDIGLSHGDIAVLRDQAAIGQRDAFYLRR